MAKFLGSIGFIVNTEIKPGVWSPVKTEHAYTGDFLRLGKTWSDANPPNNNLVIRHRISIIADDFALSNLSLMRFVVIDNIKWKIQSFEIERPRIILNIGEVYNG